MIGAVGAVGRRDLNTLYALHLYQLHRLNEIPKERHVAEVAAARGFGEILTDRAISSTRVPVLPPTYNRLGRLNDDTPTARPMVDINADALRHRSFRTVYTPEQVARAYGFDKTRLSGRGQTIAIPTAYHSPELREDLRIFNRTYGLPDAPLEIVNQNGGPPGGPTDAGWAVETALDVEWAHAVAPQAKILVVEANSNSLDDLTAAVDYARRRPDVSVISMSWGTAEFPEELRYDTVLTTPRGHRGITFVAASGDSGAGTLWPSISPNVLSVGGTSLVTTPSGRYVGEYGWAGSGGGVSTYEVAPAYQRGVQHTGMRTNPDVSYNAAVETGFSVYRGGWQTVGGTSAGAPQWAGLIALANEARSRRGLGTLNQAQALIYNLPQQDFHDVVLGSNGYLAGVGYDLVTGRGSPVADRLVRDLASPVTPPPLAFPFAFRFHLT